jgi:hypothetical protein
MPEPVSIAAAALSITVSAVTIGRQTHELIQGLKDAPKNIERLADDLHGLYCVLGSLESIFSVLSERKETNNIPRDMIENVTNFVDKCVGLYKDINKAIYPYIATNGRTGLSLFKTLKWEAYKKNDIAVLQRTLADYKATITIACTALNT